MADEELNEARQALQDRIEDIETALATVSDRALKQQIHSLKGLAAAYGLVVVAGLAHALEQALAEAGRQVPITAYLDRMNEALEASDPADPRLLGVLLGVIDARCHAA